MKFITLLVFTIITLSVKAETKYELNFSEPITLKKVYLKYELPKNLWTLFKGREIKMAILR